MPTNPVFLFPCLLLFILKASSCSAESEYFVRFVPKVPAKHQSYYYESPGPVDPIELDASSAQQVRVRIVDYMNTPPEVIIHCRIAPLDRKANLISAQLCYRKTLVDQDTCIDSNKPTIQFGNVKFESVGNRTHGYTFTTRLPVGSVQLDAFYFCKFRNIQGEVSSNMMEVQDVYYYQTKLVDLPSSGDTYLEPLTPSNFPLTLQCGSSSGHGMPALTNYNSPSPFRWSFCRIDDPNSLIPYNCFKQARNNPIRVSVYFQHIVFPNGTLILLKRTAATWADMGLICHSHLRPSKYYAVYFGGTEQNPAPIQINPSEPYMKYGITILSPISQRVVVRDGSDGDVTLMAIYQTNPSTLRYTWTKNGDPITLGFQETTPFTLQFPPTRYRNHSGTYQLNVWSGDSTARFVYDVDVVGPPEVVEPPPAFLLVMAGNEATFSCIVERFTTQALRINGQVLDPSSSSRQSKLINQFPYLKNTVIHPLRTEGSRIHYRVSNLVFPQGSLFGSSHTVTIVTGNQYGYAFVSTMIHVLPFPKIIKSPSRSPCGPPCSSLQEHRFDCRFDLKPYGLTHVEQSWMLNDTDVSMLHQQRDERSEFLVDDRTVLNLNPVPNPERAQLFAHSRATCRLRLYYPAVLKEASTSAGDLAFMNPKFIIYDSSLDPKISPDLSVDINLIAEDPPPPKSAKISWLGFVLIAVCIVLIIGVLTMCIVMRTRGETYHLDKKEHLFGLDPQKELLEDEAFHTYERAEEPPLRGSRCSLNDDSAEIGSDADGELDDYNLDPGKFNEEGSFIDQYATDTHYRSTSRLPV